MAKQEGSDGTKLPALKTSILELGERGTTQRASPERVQAVVTELRLQLRSHDEEDGRRMHHFGSRIAWFFGVLADQALERSDFVEFLKLDLGITVDTARRAVRVARFANLDQAAWGTSVVLKAASIVQLLEQQPALRKAWKVNGTPKTISDLKGVVFTLEGGRGVRFDKDRPDPVDVEDLLGELRAGAGPAAKKLSRVDAELDARVREACETVPELNGVRARVKRTPKGPRLVLELPTNGDLARASKALARLLG